jgi:hypothetical protein
MPVSHCRVMKSITQVWPAFVKPLTSKRDRSQMPAIEISL